MTSGNKTIFFCGDVHSDFDPVYYAVKAHRPAAVILLGDLQPQFPLEEELEPIQALGAEVFFIHGNHDTDSETYWARVFNPAVNHLNLHGRVVEIAGYRIAGLGGTFRGKVWYPPEKHKYRNAESYRRQLHPKLEITPRLRSSIWPDDYDSLFFGKKADILVTHEAPSCHPNGFEAIDLLAQALGVKQSFHGHHHDCLDYSKHWDALGFRAFGVGLRGVSDQDGNVVVAGEMDEERSAARQQVVDAWGSP